MHQLQQHQLFLWYNHSHHFTKRFTWFGNRTWRLINNPNIKRWQKLFLNKVTRAVGVVTTSTGGSVGITTTLITGISTAGVSVDDLVDNGNYIAGTKVASIGIGSVFVDRDSTNTSSATSQTVKFCNLKFFILHPQVQRLS